MLDLGVDVNKVKRLAQSAWDIWYYVLGWSRATRSWVVKKYDPQYVWFWFCKVLVMGAYAAAGLVIGYFAAHHNYWLAVGAGLLGGLVANVLSVMVARIEKLEEKVAELEKAQSLRRLGQAALNEFYNEVARPKPEDADTTE